MSNLIPYNLKDSVEHLRENVMDAFDRWLPQRFKPQHEDHATLAPLSVLSPA